MNHKELLNRLREIRKPMEHGVPAALALLGVLIARLEAEEVTERDVWSVPRPLAELLTLVCANVGFPNARPEYGATEELSITITKRPAIGPEEREGAGWDGY